MPRPSACELGGERGGVVGSCAGRSEIAAHRRGARAAVGELRRPPRARSAARATSPSWSSVAAPARRRGREQHERRAGEQELAAPQLTPASPGTRSGAGRARAARSVGGAPRRRDRLAERARSDRVEAADGAATCAASARLLRAPVRRSGPAPVGRPAPCGASARPRAGATRSSRALARAPARSARQPARALVGRRPARARPRATAAAPRVAGGGPTASSLPQPQPASRAAPPRRASSARRAYHQTVESRFSISSTGVV